MRRRSHGLTLVETLVVLAVAGLLMAILIAILLPSADRKVRLEAERLAAFLTAASAESVMRDAPVRVVFDIDQGKAVRQVAKLGADITSALWQEDEKAEAFEVDSPVAFDTVDSAESPQQTSGDGYLIFRGERTEGAAVVLGHKEEEVFYTVLVPPNGAEIKVERGRQGRPSGGGTPLNRDLQPFADAMDTGGKLANMPTGGLGGVNPNNLNLGGNNPTRTAKRKSKGLDSRPNTNPPAQADPVTPSTNTGNDGVTPSAPKPALNSAKNEPPPVEPDPVPPPDPTPDAPPGGLGTTCLNDLQCGPADGWAKCNTAFGVCEIDPVGRALRMTDISVTQPADPQIRNIVESVLETQIALGRLHLLTYFDSGKVWLVQGERAGEQTTQNDALIKRFRQVNSFPSYPGADLPSEGYTCDENRRCEVAFELADEEIQIYIQKFDNPPVNTCNYSVLTLQVSVEVRVTIADDLSTTVTGGAEDNQPNSYIRLTALLGTGAARNVPVQGQTLYDLLQEEIPLESAAPDDVGDINGDGQPDSWRFVFEGSAEAVSLAQPPVEDPNARPQFCL